MAFNWEGLTRLILALSRAALSWYVMLDGDPNGDERKARKAASRILDPDTPETEIDHVRMDT